MRVASTMMSTNYLKQLNSTYEQYTKIMEQSDGSKLHRASDNCVEYSKYLRYQNSLSNTDQFSTNVNTAVSWMKNSDAALVNVTKQFETFKAKVEQAANSPNNESDMKDIAKELLANIQECVAAMNTQIGDRYLFSGQSDTTCPFQISDSKKTRGETKTLDDAQATFFSGSNGVNSDTTLSQFLKLNDEAGNIYYMNVKNGDVFTKDFVDNGYKDEDSLNAYYKKGPVTNINSIAGKTIHNTGDFKTVDGAEARKVLGNSLAIYENDEVPPKQYYVNPDTGTTYNKDDVDNYLDGTSTTEPTALSDNMKFDVSSYFKNTGEITEDGINWHTTIQVAGQDVKLSFATVEQYIVSYKGDEKYISMVKKTGGVDQATDTVNVTGQDVFGTDIFDIDSQPTSGTAMLNNLLTAVAKVAAGDHKWSGDDGMTIADKAHATVLGAETKLAARQQAYDAATTMLTTQNASITSDISQVASTDVAKLATELMQYQTIYSLSLSVGSKILPGTLADYLN